MSVRSEAAAARAEESARRASLRRTVIAAGSGVVVIALLAGGIALMLGGEQNPPKKVAELTIVKILPPPPPPPPPPKQQMPEPKMIEQTPVKQELPEEKPAAKDPIKDAKADELPPGVLPGENGPGPGDLPGGGSRRGLGGGGGGGGGGSRFGWYASMVQTMIADALRAHPKTRNAALQVKARVWADASGRIVRVQIVTSSGDSELDGVLNREILSGMTLKEPPPKDMPMPIVMQIIERKST